MARAARTHRGLALGLAAAVYLADQIVKWIMIVPLRLEARGVIEILPIFHLRWVQNFGVSMGALTASSDVQRWLLVGLTATISAGVLLWLWREKLRGDAAALGLVLGGALGNLTDRVRFGYVVDFADLHFGAFRPFLVFNVADAAITVGVLLLLLRAFLMRKGSDPAEDVHA